MGPMTLDDAKRRVLDAAFDNEADAARLESGDDLQRAEARTLRADAEAFRALLSALGEPTAEAREAAAHMRMWANEYDGLATAREERAPHAPDAGWAHFFQSEAVAARREAARYRLAADALERSPDAIRRAAIEEAAQMADSWARHYDGLERAKAEGIRLAATAIRALATGATPPTLATVRADVLAAIDAKGTT